MAGCIADPERGAQPPPAAGRRKPPSAKAPTPAGRATPPPTGRPETLQPASPIVEDAPPRTHLAAGESPGEALLPLAREAQAQPSSALDHRQEPSWDESDSFRETTLRQFGDPQDREALRRVGRMLYDMALETTLGTTQAQLDESSLTRAELRAVLADLRYLEGYLSLLGRSSKECSLLPADDALARFAGRLAGKVGALARSVAERLS